MASPRDDELVSIADVGRGNTTVLDLAIPTSEPGWARYPLTVLARLRRNFPSAVRGADIYLHSDLPSAAGMSSSSALMIAVLLPLVQFRAIDEMPSWPGNIKTTEDLAAYAATIENGSSFRALGGDRGVGTQGGSEDHTAILCSRPGVAAQYAFCPTRHERSIPFPSGFVFAIGVSGIVASKTGNARDDYNRASLNATRVLDAWRTASGRDDATLAEAVASAPNGAASVRAAIEEHRADRAALLDRLDQFVEESFVLVPGGANQLAEGDLEGFGTTVARSQELAERLLRNQVPATISLARAAREEGAAAASAFGAGFGGSVWALVERSAAHAFTNRWHNAYAAAHPEMAARAAFFLTRPGPAAMRVPLGR
jgi:galactokinase